MCRQKFFILFFMALLFVFCPRVKAQDYRLYVSPGITFGWNFGNGFTYTPKVSLGVFEGDNGLYFSVTYGYNYGSRGKDKNFNFDNYHFIEVGGGKMNAFSGGALGIAFYKSHNEMQYSPKISVYTGLVLFMNMDMVFTKDGVNTNLGLQPNLPIPLQDPHIKIGG